MTDRPSRLARWTSPHCEGYGPAMPGLFVLGVAGLVAAPLDGVSVVTVVSLACLGLAWGGRR